MKAVNRTAVIVRQKEPYVKWANSVDDESPKLLPEDLKKANIYLLPEFETDRSRDEFIKKHFASIFENELSEWMIDEES